MQFGSQNAVLFSALPLTAQTTTLPFLKRSIVVFPLFMPSRREASGAKATALSGEALEAMLGLDLTSS
jgi:hypothetical protein